MQMQVDYRKTKLHVDLNLMTRDLINTCYNAVAFSGFVDSSMILFSE